MRRYSSSSSGLTQHQHQRSVGLGELADEGDHELLHLLGLHGGGRRVQYRFMDGARRRQEGQDL